MVQTWFISDTHFSHEATWRYFKDPNKGGGPLRPFTSTEEMDAYMVKMWKERVRPEDKVYHLGDVAMQKKHLKILDELPGRKTLIAGNHDIYNSDIYLKYFDNIRAYKMYPNYGIICSHIPVHAGQLSAQGRFKYNVHGHLHGNFVQPEGPDSRYLNICVEQTGYAPINFAEILHQLNLEPIKPTLQEHKQ